MVTGAERSAEAAFRWRSGSIAYIEFDGIRVCRMDDGSWCERAAGHEGAHVLRPSHKNGSER